MGYAAAMRPVLGLVGGTALAASLACAGGQEAVPADLVHTFPAPTGRQANAVAVDEGADLVAVGFGQGDDGGEVETILSVRRLSTGEMLRNAIGEPGLVESLAVDPGGAWVAVASSSRVAIVPIDLTVESRSFSCERCEVAVSPDGRLLGVLEVGSGALRIVRVDDLSTACDLGSDLLGPDAFGSDLLKPARFVLHGGAVAFSDDGATLGALARYGSLLTYAIDGCARRWGADLGLGVHDDLEAGPDGAWLVGSMTARFAVFDAAGARVHAHDGLSGEIEVGPAAWAPDGRVWVRDRDDRLALVDPATDRIAGLVPWGGPADDPRRPEGPDASAWIDDVLDFDADGPWLVVARHPTGSPVRVYRLR